MTGEKQATVLITPKECAAFLGIGKDTVKRMMTHEDFPMIWIGSHPKVVKDKVMEFLEKHNKEDFGE